MSLPKNWFRRRRAAAEEPGEEDPFAEDSVLELSETATRPPERDASVVPEGRGNGFLPIPPPRLAPRPMREGRAIDRSAFVIKPLLQRRPEPPPAERPRAPQPAAARIQEMLRSERLPPAPPGEDDVPSFAIGAPGALWRRGRGTDGPGSAAAARLRDAFTPTRPKRDPGLFAGRSAQLRRIIAAFEEERAHVVIHGERGSGKTSLANMVATKAEEAGYFVLRFACSSALGFDDIFRAFLRRLPTTFLADGLSAGNRTEAPSFEPLLPPGDIAIADLIWLLERLHERHVILIIDEWDRVTREDAKAKLAEFIKILSDSVAPVTLLLIGVADDVRELFGHHPSLQRTLVTVPMPLLTERETERIVAAGAERSGLEFPAQLRRSIVALARGLPYHAHLLALFAARSAMRRHAARVEPQDLRDAVRHATGEAEARITEAYELAVGGEQPSSFQDVLYLAARCHADEFGSFSAADVAAAADGASEVPLLSLQYPLKKLTDPERGAVLRRVAGPAGLRYQFASQMLRNYVLLRQAERRGLV